MAVLYTVKVARAVGDINAIEADLAAYEASNSGNLPNSLAGIGRGNMLDPWGHPYQYLNFATAKGNGAFRKDRFLVPLNSDYDLYSMGRDGLSQPPITAKVSQDDIIRANDGSFVGLASQY
ncbi:MAG: prepilin-type cleavage/methylation domain-containing protein [Candidatus Acidiferrales bacterium]